MELGPDEILVFDRKTVDLDVLKIVLVVPKISAVHDLGLSDKFSRSHPDAGCVFIADCFHKLILSAGSSGLVGFR